VLGTPAPATVQADIREQTFLDCGRDAEGVISNCTCQLNDCSHACTAAACLISDIDRHVNLRARAHTLPISTYTPPPPTERRVQRARPDDKEERYFDQELEYGQRGPGPRQPPTHAPDATHTPHTHLRGPESPYPNPETTCLQAPSSHPQSASQVSPSTHPTYASFPTSTAPRGPTANTNPRPLHRCTTFVRPVWGMRRTSQRAALISSISECCI
jgi:hypothetical protein